MATAANDFARIVIRETGERRLSDAEEARLGAVAEGWLRPIDAGKFAESWEGVSAELKAKYARDRWKDALRPLIGKVGASRSRRLASVDYSTAAGDAVAVEFDASFAKLATATEVVILKRGPDGRWYVASYSIH